MAEEHVGGLDVSVGQRGVGVIKTAYARMCAGKHRHKSLGAAEAHLRSVERRGLRAADRMSVYACHHCGYFHVGRKRRSQD